ncbi:MAG: FKBP-type peptidyl-prolyl cis-trans isomerase [Bacteroidota bacterium]|nr:FKBP-type peptidyl-prolyl cis-trans isomerase [Bacteroidota bacterium]MDP4190757.1 FKBP-type peptidyl-prolyl cis-trans isomerase [Bacteroidota bacterium]MDP4194661.1 FKBP-type peptidyl-prolyl cis-trans isomerase [Bacteroidota bacterium]
MTQAKYGDIVKVRFTGKLEDGKVFASSEGDLPLEFKIGSGKLLEGFEEAVIGMSPGEKKIAKISAEKGFGVHNNKLVIKVEKDDFFENMTPELGQTLELNGCEGIPITITGISDSTVTLDANHPLVGKDLIFEIDLIEIL